MLIGTRAFHLGQLDRMAALSREIGDRQTAISSSKRFQAASQDPAAAQQSAALRRRQADNALYTAGLDFAEQRLSIADDALGSMTNVLARVNELALKAANDTEDAGGRAIFATEARELLNVLVSLANTQDASGNYLFAGARAADAPFGFDATGAVEYRGLGEAAAVAIGPGAQIVATEPGDRLFGGVETAGATRSVFRIVEDFIAVLEVPAPAPDDTAGLAAQRTAFDQAIAGSRASVESIANARAGLGGRLNRIEAERDSLAATGDALTEARSRLEDSDLAAEITLLQRASLVLEAAQRSFVQVSSLSLFNELR